MKKMRCAACGHPEAERSSAADGRPAYTCTRCKHYWTQGYPESKRKANHNRAIASHHEGET